MKNYHNDRTYLTSSALKMLLKDPAEFYSYWLLGQKDTEEKPQFDEGSYVHALCLEPHTITENFAFWEGFRKAGDKYKEWAACQSGKIILNAGQKLRSEKLHQAYQGRVEAVRMLSGGYAEHTLTGIIADIPVKIRADYINIDKGYIVDIKTTAYPAILDIFRQTIDQYHYDLSAALYREVAQQTFGKKFDFYFMPISKMDLVCDIYKLSDTTSTVGFCKLMSALELYKRCSKTGIWELKTDNSFDSKDYEILEV